MYHATLEQLGKFQQALRDALEQEKTPEAVTERLLSDPKLTVFRDYIQTMNSEMLAIGLDLVLKYGDGGLGGHASKHHILAGATTRPLTPTDIPHIVSYFTTLSPEDSNRMGINTSALPTPDQLRSSFLSQIDQPAATATSGIQIWDLNGKPVGMNTIKNMTIGDTGFMHLHMWAENLRGQGYGAQFFCMAALRFYEQFHLKQIFCEPKSSNPAPNRMLGKIGFPLVLTHVAQSSTISDICELNRYQIEPSICLNYLGKPNSQKIKY